MEDSSSTASNVARAIVAVLDYNSTSETRKSAVQFLESVNILFWIFLYSLFSDRFVYLWCSLWPSCYDDVAIYWNIFLEYMSFFFSFENTCRLNREMWGFWLILALFLWKRSGLQKFVCMLLRCYRFVQRCNACDLFLYFLLTAAAEWDCGLDKMLKF